eukprot:CAMPEP_0206372878 /NCGR_PEP_ID=MMETSP0294-20121207/7375_1 /ASSEMBLY_ACC=CAM_ASM_000327 /TAXON_ID=39354 /ORGANISM="Heterosigma akashiwo, Strain CCMP2393" /LENGTH=78 /DNA_ID=CAMNT_0053820349 /DNA_START=18 /DNA_END=254 /DNA_ORIENTATION=-
MAAAKTNKASKVLVLPDPAGACSQWMPPWGEEETDPPSDSMHCCCSPRASADSALSVLFKVLVAGQWHRASSVFFVPL